MKTMLIKLGVAAVAAALLAGCATRPASRAFSFALVGDQQYDAREEQLFPALMASMDAADVKFLVHVGDFKAGSNSQCSDELYLRRRAEFDQSHHPFIFTPGDNDWVDCRRPSNGSTDPLERLAKLRELFFADGQSLGRERMPLKRQSAVFAADPVLSRYRENTMWNESGVVFATFNIQGGNDNLGFDPASDREHAERSRANVAWLKLAAEEAARDGNIALVIFMQANPGFEEPPAEVRKSGYAEFLKAFESTAEILRKPVLFAHGDTHTFRIDRPYRSPLDKRPLANVTRLETYGSPFVNWVRITVDPANRQEPFEFRSGGFAAPVAN